MARTKKTEVELPVITSISQLTKPVGEISKEAYLDFGNYINNHRHMAEVKDGLKISYRRLIWSAMQFPKGKLIPTTTLISNVANYHPHSLTGIEGLNAELVKSGVFSGEGSFGFTSIDGTDNPHAAPRYTKNALSDKYWEICGDLIKEVPMVESPVGALEPQFIPLPLPLVMYIKTSVVGLGVGIMSQYPNFSPESMFDAYVQNNPQLLKPNVNLTIDYSKSELNKLWTTGKGTVTYCFKTYRTMDTSGKVEGIMFEGDTCLFTPKLSKFKKLAEEGKVFIDDMTDFNGPKLFIGRVPNARITIDEIEKLAKAAAMNSTVYQLNITDGSTSCRIALYTWIDYMYKNYINLKKQANQRKIEQTTFDINVQTALPLIAEYIINKNPKAENAEIAKALNINEEIVSVVMTKPISYIRKNKDTSDRVKELKNKLSELKKFDAITYTNNIIKQL